MAANNQANWSCLTKSTHLLSKTLRQQNEFHYSLSEPLPVSPRLSWYLWQVSGHERYKALSSPHTWSGRQAQMRKAAWSLRPSLNYHSIFKDHLPWVRSWKHQVKAFRWIGNAAHAGQALLPEVALSVTGRTYAQEQHNFLEDSINMRQPRFLFDVRIATLKACCEPRAIRLRRKCSFGTTDWIAAAALHRPFGCLNPAHLQHGHPSCRHVLGLEFSYL